jgi:hypothetical protein
MFKDFLITWLRVIEQTIYQRIQAGIIQTAGACNPMVPAYGRVMVLCT